MKRFTRIDEIVIWRLCLGCGACAAACPEQNITIVDVPSLGLRPVVGSAKCRHCKKCVAVCSGIETSKGPCEVGAISELQKGWGDILEVWEGYAADPDIRYRASSGGVATALSLFCLEKKQMGGVLQTRADSRVPWQNIAVLSTSRSDILACTGSRYSPAAPCAGIDLTHNAPASCVFVGKPCDVVAVRKLESQDPQITAKIALTISIFCAGTPSSQGSKAIVTVLGIEEERVAEMRYRGFGWPGETKLRLRGSNTDGPEMSYEESWGGILSKHVQFRCRLCPDSTGEMSDISCGDAWYKDVSRCQPGYSLVLARTERGRQILQEAVELGYLVLHRSKLMALALSQQSLLDKKQNIWGRLVAMRMLGVPYPRFNGFHLFSNWCDLPVRGKARSLLGTAYRIFTRRWRKPLDLKHDDFATSEGWQPSSAGIHR